MRFLRAVHWLLVFVILSVSASAFAQVSISVNFGPPALPVYEQPLCPGDGFIWVPGYWAWGGPYGYYWVPGTWVLAPEPGFLWTPAWWGWDGGAFLFHEGYWGPRVGFYGGISYGFGYFGHGYEGGRWEGDRFFYNRSVNNINVTNIHNVYNTTIINNNTTVINRVSYNGGQGGLTARPTSEEEAAGRERHVGPTANQTRHVELARDNPELRASSNHGKPPIAATPRPTEFQGHEVTPAREAGGPYKAPENRGENNVPRPPVPTHAKDLQPPPRMDAPNTGNTKLDAKYQKQQDKLYAQQEKDHQKMAQQQEKEHEKLAKQNAQEAQRQQVEQRHQQQTMQMEQQHEQQRQNLQMHQQPQSHGGPPPQHR